MDNGSFHKSLNKTWPDNVIPIFQPANSPELNPIERLWEHIKYQLIWEHCTNLDELRMKLTIVLNSLSPDAIALFLWMGLHHQRPLKCNFIENWYKNVYPFFSYVS
jgi:transposase